jgi:hypothetical protein
MVPFFIKVGNSKNQRSEVFRGSLVYSGEHLRADEMQQDLERLMIQTGER